MVRHPPLQERIKQEVQGYIDKVSSFDQVSQAEAEAVAKNLEASSFTADMIREAKAENNPESIGAESKDKVNQYLYYLFRIKVDHLDFRL